MAVFCVLGELPISRISVTSIMIACYGWIMLPLLCQSNAGILCLSLVNIHSRGYACLSLPPSLPFSSPSIGWVSALTESPSQPPTTRKCSPDSTRHWWWTKMAPLSPSITGTWVVSLRCSSCWLSSPSCQHWSQYGCPSTVHSWLYKLHFSWHLETSLIWHLTYPTPHFSRLPKLETLYSYLTRYS